MRILIISDIHGNFHALEGVMNEVGYDVAVCCGDIVVDYPFPEQCVQAIKGTVSRICLGNNDYAVAYNKKASENLGAKYAHYAAALDKVTDLTADMVSNDSKEYLLGLPRESRFVLDGISFYMNHTVPDMPLHHYVDVTIPLSELDGYYENIQADVILTGHTHVPYLKKCGDKIVINPGSVGEPRDGDPRASFATLDTFTGRIAFGRLEYDTTETIKRLKELGFPNYSLFCLRNGYLPDNPDEA